MQACLENTSLPMLESVPVWTIRVARPTTPGRDELAQELRGVPKAALRHVFGNVLGTRLWQQYRAVPTSAKPAPAATTSANAFAAATSDKRSAPTDASVIVAEAANNLGESVLGRLPLDRIADAEISSGMLHYLCAEATAALRQRKCVAKSVALTVLYSDGESETVREPLLPAANDLTALETAARLALHSMRRDVFVSLKLDLTATSTYP